MLTGEVCRRKSLQTAGGRTVEIAVLKPAPTLENIELLRKASDTWDSLAGRVSDPFQQRRAYFAASVVFLVGTRLAHEYGVGTPRCCYIVAIDESTGEVLGAATYDQRRGSWHLDNMAISPKHQHNNLDPDPIRGIGITMLSVIANDVRQTACTNIYLETLDDRAAAFWKARGFHDTTEPLHLTCPEVNKLADELWPHDQPDQGDTPFAVTPQDWRDVEVPARKALVYAVD